MPPATMTATWMRGVGAASTAPAANTASVTRGAFGAKGSRHAPYGLRDHRNGDDLETVQQATGDRILERHDSVAESDESNRRRHRESGPGGERARQTGLGEPDPDTDLARRRPRQELAQRHEIGIGPLVDPSAANHERFPEVSQVRDGSAKGGQAELEEGEENAPGGLAFRRRLFGFGLGTICHRDAPRFISNFVIEYRLSPW